MISPSLDTCTSLEETLMTGRLVLLCGKSFSGKSTVAASLADHLPGSVVSLDAINEERGLHGGDGIPLSEWARTNELAKQQALARLHKDETVIVDDTSSPRFLRDGWRSLCSSIGAPIALVFVDTSQEVTRQRLIDNRVTRHRGDVTDEVMAAHQESFEPPDEDEQAVLLATGSGPTDLDGLCTTLRGLLNQAG